MLALRSALVTILCLFALGALSGNVTGGIKLGLAFISAMLTGVVLGPLLLP